MPIDSLSLGGGACDGTVDYDAWAAGQAVPIASLTREQFAVSAAADPRGLAESDPTARLARTDEPLFSEDVLHSVAPGIGGCGILLSACSVPQTVLLFASPASCVRHWSVIGYRDGWRDRAFALELGENDYVMGVNADLIGEAVEDVLARLPEPPRAFFVGGACVDALLGTDLEGICRELTARHGIPFMDVLLSPIAARSSTPLPTRAHRAVYGLLNMAGPVAPELREDDAANLVVNFSLVDPRDDIFDILRDMGYPTVRQLRACRTYDDFLEMRRSAVNICPRPFGRPACKEMERVLGIPFAIVGPRLLPEMVETEFARFSSVVGRPVDLAPYRRAAEQRLDGARSWMGGVSVAVGGHGANAFETATLLARLGAHIAFILEDRVSAQDWPLIDELAALQPDLPVYPTSHPAFALAGKLPVRADVAVGLEAGRLSPGCSMVDEEDEFDHLGFSLACSLVDEMREALDRPIGPEDYYYRRSRVRRCDEGGPAAPLWQVARDLAVEAAETTGHPVKEALR